MKKTLSVMLLSLPFALSAQTPTPVEKSIRSFELGEVVVTATNPADSLSAVLLAIGQEGKPLNKQEGPLQIIAPNDRLHSRWIREVKHINVTYPRD